MVKSGGSDDTLQISKTKDGPEPQLPPNRRFSLVVLEGRNAGEEFRIDKWTVIIGRDASVSDFVLEDPGASRSHACLEYDNQSFVIEDLESTNGLSVNQKPTSRAPLKHGDKITIGKTTLQFLIEDIGKESRIYEIKDL